MSYPAIQAFLPQGPTVALVVGTATSNTEFLIPGDYTNTYGDAPNNQCVRLVNVGTEAVTVNFGHSDVTATAPAAGTPESGLVLLPNTEKTLSIPTTTPVGGTYIAAIAAATGSTLYITPGIGL